MRIFSERSREGFTPLEELSVNSGNVLDKISIPCRRSKVKASFFLTGFTLIEVVVVIGITAILMAMSLGYNRNSERQIILFSEQAKVVGILERAKNLALARYKAGDTEFCGIGVYFDATNAFTIFGDKISEDDCNGYYTADNDVMIESQPLDSRLAIAIGTDGSVIFKPPYGEVVLGNSLTLKPFPIDIILEDGKSNKATIEVSSGGGVTMK